MDKKLFFYTVDEKLLISQHEYDLNKISEEKAKNFKGRIYSLVNIDMEKSRRSFCVTSPSNIFIDKEDLNLLIDKEIDFVLPEWILDHINNRNITAINTAYNNWMEVLNTDFKGNKKWTLTVVGLGDVGGTLITGLRLLGGDCIESINIYDKDESKVKRWNYECSQILWPDNIHEYPSIIPAKENDLFNCDMFVFCVSVGVPSIGKEISDVRIAQLEGNRKIINYYAKLACENKFKGIFAVVSDPVDLLCKAVLEGSNKCLCPEQIRGYGLGVMHARACYYASLKNFTSHYKEDGRAFGPHGEGLIIADSMKNYNNDVSIYLTEKTKKANLEVRSIGFKPYIAPALSSGALSLISTIKGHWHYSATFLGGTFMGSKNRLLSSGIELETYKHIDKILFKRLQNTYNYLLYYNE